MKTSALISDAEFRAFGWTQELGGIQFDISDPFDSVAVLGDARNCIAAIQMLERKEKVACALFG